MPRISYFLGISVYLHADDNRRFDRPHIHVYYARNRTSFSIETGQLLSGALPKRRSRYTREWIETRRSELLLNWERAQRLEPTTWINPL